MTTGAPTIYFIDDSATMREVIKIAFRRENMNVLACHDGAAALAQMEQIRPDVVISDVIMPEKDGYEVCEYIKQHARLSHTPVILMSGVVNRSVAERAFAAKADELIRKPFQPQDLIGRVKTLLNPKTLPAQPPATAASTNAALSSIFATTVSGMPTMQRRMSPSTPRVPAPLPMPSVAAAAMAPRVTQPAQPRVADIPAPSIAAAVATPTTATPAIAIPMVVPAPPAPSRPSTPVDLQKLKIEVLRLEGLVRKLQSELAAEREYSHALEAHIKTLQEAD